MEALFKSPSCLRKCLEPGWRLISFSSASAIRWRISAAEAFVKVTINRRSTSSGFSSEMTFFMIRSTRTAVFPLPAAAATRISLPSEAMAFHWSSVQSASAGFFGNGVRSFICFFLLSQCSKDGILLSWF